MARALSLPLSVVMLAQTLSISDIARAFRERVDIMNAGVVFRGVDTAEAEQLSSGNVSVSGVRIPVRFEGPARWSGADGLERIADASFDVASGSSSGSRSASEASSSFGRTA